MFLLTTLLTFFLCFSINSLAASTKQKTTTIAPAQNTLKATTTSQKWSQFKEWIKQKGSVSIFFATAENMSSNGYSSANQSGWAKMSASPSFGISAQLSQQPWQNAAWYATVSLEQEHELSSLQTGTQSGVQSLTIINKPGFRPFMLGGGVQLHPHKSDKYFYSLGLNLPVLTDVKNGEFASLSMRGEMGWQIFAHMRLKKEVSVEAGWREIRYNSSAVKTDGTTMQLGSQHFGGFSIAGRYSF